MERDRLPAPPEADNIGLADAHCALVPRLNWIVAATGYPHQKLLHHLRFDRLLAGPDCLDPGGTG